MNLSGRRVLVTGANRGVGAAFVDAALARGAARVYAGARDVAALPPFSAPDRVVGLPLDVTDHAAVRAAARTARDVDLVVSNAGVSCNGPVVGTDGTADFEAALDVNLLGPMRLAQAFGTGLARPDAGMIFVLSVGAVALSRSSPLYSASKAACLMLALGVGEELRSGGAAVTNVLPGFIDTDMGAAFDMPKASPEQIAQRSLDGWMAGARTVWPDRFAQLVHDAVGEPFRALLDEPQATMNAVKAAYRAGAVDE
jgi:NAD(P)-dependent dehydrogenase (short-subunit alcohol dehydrogenase family)